MRSTVTALAGALCAVTTFVQANPLPPNVAHILPGDFTLAPLITPSPPPNAPSSSSSLRATNDVETNSHIVTDSYLVVLNDELDQDQLEQHHDHVQALHEADVRLRSLKKRDNVVDDFVNQAFQHEFQGIKHKFQLGTRNKHNHGKKMRGYSGHFSPSTLDAIRALKGVKYVEKDSIVYTQAIERGAPWGLARISHRKTLGFGTFSRYDYDGHGGEGVDAYVIDTGINIDHVEFEGRAKWGKTIPRDADKDLNGHGTHVAGTIGSKQYGVAKKANLIAVKVLGAGGSGTMSDVVAGVAWAADAAYEKAQLAIESKDKKHKGSVANMSLGGGKSQALDDAVDSAVNDGLHFAVAAGNDAKDACAYSPAASKEAITVGATSIGDELTYFSNHGPCTDVLAPGLNIRSTWNTGNNSVNTISGTSMASPHVAGLAAYFLSLYPDSFNVETQEFVDTPKTSFIGSAQAFFGFGEQTRVESRFVGDKPLSPRALKKAIQKVATKNAITGVLPQGTPNILIFNNYTTSG
ncbi:proteinase B [Microbotryomycetes sp. JL221]|nr:proteinase B [Microbotryomycetes sp. JL221]